MAANNRLHRYFFLYALPVILAILNSCTYSSNKTDYPVDFKYASVAIDSDGIPDSLKTELEDSILSAVRRADFIIANVESLNEEQRDSLMLVQACLIESASSFTVTMSFYPYGGNIFSEIYFSGVKKEDPIGRITVTSRVPFSADYNRRRAIEMLNNGFILKGGIRDLFGKE